VGHTAIFYDAHLTTDFDIRTSNTLSHAGHSNDTPLCDEVSMAFVPADDMGNTRLRILARFF
jgi:hypothetical protein